MEEEMRDELMRGSKTAHQLRDLLATEEERYKLICKNDIEGLSSMKHYSSMILQTFDNAISLLKTSQPSDPTTLPHSNRRSKPDELIFNKTATTEQDGYSWRKYGQKPIVKARYPREYYRCTNRDHGCRATKQVQIISDNPAQYKITYQGNHTCESLQTNNSPHHFHLSDLVEPDDSAKMLSFQFTNEASISKQGQPTSSHQQYSPSNDDESKAQVKQLDQTIIKENMEFVVHDDGSGLGTSVDHTSLVELAMAHGGPPSPGWFGPMASPDGRDIDYGYLLASCADIDTGVEL